MIQCKIIISADGKGRAIEDEVFIINFVVLKIKNKKKYLLILNSICWYIISRLITN